jgi:hypothetical protein
MRKILLGLIATATTCAFADGFQDFNNNLYAQYNYISLDQGTSVNFNDWGLGGTFQTKTNIWLNTNAVAGTGTYTNGNSVYNNQAVSNYMVGIKAGYAFQFAAADTSGFQIIPYINIGAANMTGLNTGETSYTYGAGLKPEYRLLSTLKLSVDANIYGVQQGQSAFTTSGQRMNYAITPEVQYDIAKTVMLSVGYTYDNSFNSQGNLVGDNGNSILAAKVGYLF